MKPIKLFIFLLFTAGWLGCKESYEPPLTGTNTTFLVVEGFIDCGDDATIIHLSRTFQLTDTAVLQPEKSAQVSVESENGFVEKLVENSDGAYFSAAGAFSAGQQYRLRIKTADGKEYLSDKVLARQVPPIDSITWKRDNNGVAIAVSTHDLANQTMYYQWSYEETWQIHSAFFSSLKLVNGQVVTRDLTDPQENIYNCRRFANATGIHVGTSARMQQDVILQQPLLQIPDASEKLAVRYSILVKQYALDKEAYAFLQLMKKNTETLGSIFDALPAELSGNIHSTTNAADKVIGYITASSVETKRIFIEAAQLPAWGYAASCPFYEIPNKADSIALYFKDRLLPYTAKYEGLTLVSYFAAEPICVDCTLRGTNIKPLFW